MENKYLIKLWLLTLALAPFIYSIYEFVIGVEGQIVTLLEVLPITLLFSLVFSIPTLSIIFIVNRFISNRGFSKLAIKGVNVLIALVGIVCTLILINGSFIKKLIPIYIIGLTVSAIIIEIVEHIKLNRKQSMGIDN